ncbi:ribonuclease T2 family protein [Alteraurantiacibacter aquimixticola]|uniref:Ribonuclease T n=1 Tax=Alteraurantiacibacter aquimixticola TaxID=2489173 RepID=A0A4T3EYZ5_9SPHN|nr:ribonuclease T [Alteraurantiacibacter aquimixticola]TIX49089.1 ribonuclease T [Alteraurantiacibacter aquimixticola]
MVRRKARLSAALLLAFAGAALPAAALAQAYQCSLPAAPSAVPAIEQDGPTRLMPVSGYTLALSWSPEFCRTRGDSPRHARQCSGREGRFGFIVHGLWPNGRGESWPQWCPTRIDLNPAMVRRNMCMTPDTRLLARQWAKHGSCMGVQPQTWLRVTRVLWNSLRWPDFDRLSRRDDLTAGDIRTAFTEANPHWEVEHIGLRVNSRGWLQEMRLCYARDFKPMRCTPGRFGPAGDEEVKIWRGL